MRKLKLSIACLFLVLIQFSFSQNVENTDYIQILIYGQSLGMGWQAPCAITTVPIVGNYMLGDSPLIMYNNQQTVLTPLVATVWKNGGEQPIVSCVNVFSDLYRKNVNANTKFIAMTGGEGGQTIERLSKECTNSGYYQYGFTRILNNTISALPAGTKVSCPAIIYMQGEYNCYAPWAAGQGMTPGTNGTLDKNEFKRLLLQLKNNMQADIMAKYGQTKKPVFFIYQSSGYPILTKEMPIDMAQFEFAEENDDVIMVNPHYALPDYSGIHLSSNGSRWFGEKTGKIMYDYLVDRKSYEPIHPTNFSVVGTKLAISYYVPVPPLVLDTWTTGFVPNYGFAIYKDNVAVSIKSVQISNANQVVLTCNSDLSGGSVEVVYAGTPTWGTGNVCDSYSCTSKYTYFDDSADSLKEGYTPTDKYGVKLYGKNYPMQNWSTGFYKKIDATSAVPDINNDNKLIISPNPTKGIIHISNKEDNQNVFLYDNKGNLLKKTIEKVIDISSLSNGVYFLKTGGLVFKTVKAN